MKKLIMAGLIVAVASVALAGDYNDLGVTSVKAEAERLSKMGIRFPDSGNAAELYLPYLKSEAEITKQDWFKEINFTTLNEPQEGDLEKLEKGVKLAEKDIEAALKASRMDDCKLWGFYYNPDPSVNIFAQPFPDYINLIRLSTLIVKKGNQLEKAGDNQAALEHYRAVLRTGHQLEKDSFIIGYMIGVALKKQAAKSLSGHYKDRGMNEAAEKWNLYREIQEMRGNTFRALSRSIMNWDEEQTRQFVMDKDIPYSFRLETLAQKKYCVDSLDSKIGMIKCVILGPPGWVEDLAEEFGKQDELSRQFAEQIMAHDLSLSDMEMMGSIE